MPPIRGHVIRTILVGSAVLLGGKAAEATPYAFSSNQVTDIGITGNFTVIPGTAVAEAADASSYIGFAPAGSVVSGPIDTLVDVPQATSGPGLFPSENNYANQAGLSGGMVGSRGDGIITAGVAGTVSASNVAESYGSSLGSAQGKDTAAFNFSFMTAGVPTTISVAFNDQIYLNAFTAALPLESSNAHISNDFTVTNAVTGAVVFEFTPNGAGPGAVTGGTSSSDPFNINTQVASTVGSLVTPVTNFGFFSATSDPLLPNTEYNVSVISSSTTSITPGTAVPEPAALSLFGAGLIALAAVRRRS